MFASAHFKSSNLYEVCEKIIYNLDTSMWIAEKNAIQILSKLINDFFNSINLDAKRAIFEELINNFKILELDPAALARPFLGYKYFRLLHILVAAGDKESLQIFLSLIPKEKLIFLINEIQPTHGNPLVFAIYSNNPDIAQLLINNKADKTLVCDNQASKSKLTPFEIAAISGLIEFLDVFYFNPIDYKNDLYKKIVDLLNFYNHSYDSTVWKMYSERLLKVVDYLKAKNWPGFENFDNEFDSDSKSIRHPNSIFYNTENRQSNLASLFPLNLYRPNPSAYMITPTGEPIAIPVLSPILVTPNEFQLSRPQSSTFFKTPQSKQQTLPSFRTLFQP